MTKKAIYITIVFTIASLVCFYLYLNFTARPQGINEDLQGMVVKYDPVISSTFKKPYTELKNELLYARLSFDEKGQARRNMRMIRNKDQLIEIVREFDKLKSTIPQEYNFAKVKSYTLTIWRKGRACSFVFVQNNSNFYEGSPMLRNKKGDMVLRKMPGNLVQMIMDISVKEYVHSSSLKKSAKPMTAKVFDVELEKKRQEHFAKVNAVEAAIQKHVKYKTEAAFEKNIDFLLSNDIGLDKELIGYYIAGYYGNIKNKKIKARADKFFKTSSSNGEN